MALSVLSATRKALGLLMGNFAIQGKGLRSKSSQCSILNSTFHPKCGSQSPQSDACTGMKGSNQTVLMPLKEPYSRIVNRDVNATPHFLVQKLPISYWRRTRHGFEYLGNSEDSIAVREGRGGEKLHPKKSIEEEMKNFTCVIIDCRPYDVSGAAAEPHRSDRIVPC